MPQSTITVGGINPALKILGAVQQLNYTQQLSNLQLNNSFVPIVSVPAQTNIELRNNLYSGFRFIHLTNNTNTFGSLTLQSFVNAASTGTNLVSFDQSGNFNINIPSIFTSTATFTNTSYISLFTHLDFNNTATGLNAIDPINPTDLSNKNYVDTSISTLTLNNIGLPTGNVNFNGHRAINAADPLVPSDLVTQNYVSTIISNLPATLNLILTGDVTANGYLSSSISTTFNGPQGVAYISGNVTTTTITANVFTKLLGTYISSFLNDFTLSGNSLIYTGTGTKTFNIRATLSLNHNVLLGTTLSVAIYKNGIQILPISSQYQATTNAETYIGVSANVSLGNSDYIELWGTAANNATIVLTDGNFTITL